MKFAVFTVGMPELTPEEGLQQLQAHGYDGVEWRVAKIDPAFADEAPSYWKNNLCTIDEAKMVELAPATKDLCAQYGLAVSALCTYMRSGDGYELVEQAMEAAQKMGATQIRVNPPAYDGKEDYNTLFAGALKDYGEIEKLAKQYGIKVLVEMHMNTITPSASAALRLVSHFDPQYIGVIYDTGNVVYEGLEQYKMALEILGDYLAHVHLKNAAWIPDGEENGALKFKPDWAPFKEGFANFPAVFQALKAVGYDGWVTFEDFSTQDTLTKLRDNLAYIKSIVEGGDGQ